MSRIVVGAALAALSLGQAHAMSYPRSCGPDPSVLCVPFKDDDVVNLVLSPDVPTVITLHPGETLPHDAMLDDTQFDMKKFNGPNVYIRPVPSYVGHQTTLSILAVEPDNTQRYYTFAITTADKGGPRILHFTFPEDVAKERAEKAKEWGETHRNDVVESRLKTSVFYGGTNHAYECECLKGPDIKAEDITDNGQSTVFKFPGRRQQPTIAIQDAAGHEYPQTGTRMNDLVVVPAVAQFWVLRMAPEVVRYRNMAFHPERGNPFTGTASTEVVRVLTPTPPGKPAFTTAVTPAMISK